MDEYITKIIAEFNKHAKASDKLQNVSGALFEQGFHAFMANAINMRILKSENNELRDRFAIEAYHS